MNRRKLLKWTAGSAASIATPLRARAAAYPTRPLRWIVGFPAGGAADILARIVAAQLSERLGQQVVVENRPGAGTSLAASALLSAPPDGYTLLLLGSSTIAHALSQGHQQSFLQNIVPVAGLTITSFVIVTHASAPYATLADLIAAARTRPGQLRVGSYGVGTQSQLAAQLFSETAGIEVVHVPYRGGAPLVVDLLGQHIDVAFDTVASSLPHIRDGALRGLAVTAHDRVAILPDVPAVTETMPGYEMTVWTGVGVPRGTPAGIVQRLNGELTAALAEPEILSKFSDLAIRPMPYSLDDFGAFWSTEMDRTRKLIDKIGIRLH